MKEIGSYEAKTRLPALLREVAQGRSFSITRNGKPVALLLPPERTGASTGDTIRAIRALRRGIRLGDESLKALIEEGRR